MSDPPDKIVQMYNEMVADGIHPMAARTLLNFRFNHGLTVGIRKVRIGGMDTDAVIVPIGNDMNGILAWIPGDIVTITGDDEVQIGSPPKKELN